MVALLHLDKASKVNCGIALFFSAKEAAIRKGWKGEKVREGLLECLE